MNVRLIAERLAAVTGTNVKSDGAGGFLVVCPAHDDAEPSLHVAKGKRQSVLVHCHAGCSTAAVLAAAGLCFGDLCGGVKAPNQWVTAEYVYEDEAGRSLFTVSRRGHGRGKRFAAYRVDERGELVSGARGVRRVLYRLPAVLAAVARRETIYLCEGEKDADAMTDAYGVTATTNPFGAISWANDCECYGYGEALRGAHVVIVQDGDATGRRRTAQLRASLGELALELRVVEACVGKDASDHIAAGRRLDELVEIEEGSCTDDGGFAAVPHALRAAVAAGNLTHLEYRVLLEITCLSVRRENGEVRWQPIPCPSSWIARCCGNASPSAVRDALCRLRVAGMLLEEPAPEGASRGSALSYRVNGDYSAWRPLAHARTASRPPTAPHLSSARTATHLCEDTSTREDLELREEGVSSEYE